MNTARRNVLKGIIALGSASALNLVSPLWASSNIANNTIHLIVANDDVGHAFYQGANTVKSIAIQSSLHSATSLPFLEKYQSLLKTKGQRIFGLVDDASAVLIMDLARTTNARILWQKDHVIHSNESAVQLGLGLVSNTINSAMTEQIAFKKHYVSFLIES